MALSAQLTTDVESVANRVLALYERLVNCDSSSVNCATIPNILNWPFSSNAGHIYLQRSRLLQIHSAVMNLFSDYAIRRGFMNAADCAGSVVPTEAVAVCRTLADVSLSKLEQPREHAFLNDQWLANIDLVVSAIEGLFSEENPCPDEICAPCSCPCTSWLTASWPCGDLVEQYTISGTIEIYGSQSNCENSINALTTASFSKTVTASTVNIPFSGCWWRWDEDPKPTTGLYQLQLLLNPSSPCFWGVYARYEVSGSRRDASMRKYVGGTPVGSDYVPTCNQYTSYYGKITNGSIVEAT